ncbi:MAG: GNAT family N-acetyltransferase [Defluviitaleaceae bacterium]|nr:GNAT family N-acetyltransferase [Defluviitaleaceae bacterium]
MFEMREIIDANEKSRICGAILRALPDWFGVEDSIVDYVNQVPSMPFFAVYDGETVAGFTAVKVHNPHTAEVCVMGVLNPYHRRGIGKMLVACCEKFCRERNMDFLTVKTLDASRDWPPYEKTRNFYLSVGFKPLEVFPLLWDECNPCLFMAKYVGGDKQ